METQRDIIIVGIQPWDIEIGSNCKNMALELSKKHRVLYVNPALDSSTAYRNSKATGVKRRTAIIKGTENSLNQINENLWEFNPPILLSSINWLPDPFFNIANKRNNKLFAAEIAKVLVKLNFKNTILFNDSDMFRSFYLKELLKPQTYIYYTRDNLMTVPYWKKHGKKYEPLLMKMSDFVLGNSSYLVENAKCFNPNSYYIGQGCDLSLFSDSSLQIPEDLSYLFGKVIGYVGLLSGRRLDIDLLVHLAKTRLDWNIVLVGPEEDDFKNSPLHGMLNVHFLGNKPVSQLPSYIKHFDVCINPQALNPLTVSNYPRKIDEYLIMGKPVVATATPTMQYFKEHVYLSTSNHDFVAKIVAALKEDSLEKQQQRKLFAQEHSWENCINSFWTSISHSKS